MAAVAYQRGPRKRERGTWTGSSPPGRERKKKKQKKEKIDIYRGREPGKKKRGKKPLSSRRGKAGKSEPRGGRGRKKGRGKRSLSLSRSLHRKREVSLTQKEGKRKKKSQASRPFSRSFPPAE